MDDLISVIVPVYNVEDYLEKSLSSLLIQTYRKLQVIIIDDGSTDNTLKVLEKCKDRFGAIEILKGENIMEQTMGGLRFTIYKMRGFPMRVIRG